MNIECEIAHVDTSNSLLFQLKDYHLFRVFGPDSSRYLQGRLTQDIAGLKSSSYAKSLLLTPQGKTLASFVIYKRDDDFMLLTEPIPNGTDSFIKDLLQFKVADQVEVELLSANFQFLSLQGESSKTLLESTGLTNVPVDNTRFLQTTTSDSEYLIAYNPRGTNLGFDIIVSKTNVIDLENSLIKEKSCKIGSAHMLNLLRIRSSMPLYGNELNSRSLASDITLDEYVSFSKGCYCGQEALEKSIAIGHPNRKLLQLIADTISPLKEGSSLSIQAKEESSAGIITTACFMENKKQTLCLAMVKSKYGEHDTFYSGDIELKTCKDYTQATAKMY